MRLFVIILLFALLFISQINTVLDVDLWWNLKTGEYIVGHLDVPRTDIFSYALENRPWIDHEWLSQALFYAAFSLFGWPGLNILKALVISLCFFTLLHLVFSRYKKISFAIFFILMSILAFGYRSFVRPEIFSYLFLCVFLYILEKEKGIYVLPFLQILWVNIHGYFILGPILIFLYSIGEFFSKNSQKAKRLGAALLLIIAACFINPYFYKGALYPLGILLDVFGEQKLYMLNVHELMMPVRSGFGRYVFFWLFAIATSITFIINLKNAKIKHILVFAGSFLASYMAVRNMPVFIFLAMPLAAINLNESGMGKRISEKRYYVVYAAVILGLIYFFLSGKYYVFTNQYPMRKTESRFSSLFMPSGACDFLEKNKIEGRMFNTLDFGPYIGYRFYPEKRILIDTRTDLYKDDFYLLYREAQYYPGEWDALSERYGFNIALLRHIFSGTERLLAQLHKNKDWKLVYYDKNSCIFLEDTPGNKKFIERFEIDFSEKTLHGSDIDFNIARFFEKIGHVDLAEKIYVKLLEIDPGYLAAGNNLASIYINSGRYNEGLDLIAGLLGHYPRSAVLYANMGEAYARLGQREKGLLLLEKAARIDPYLRKVSYMLGISYLEKGDIDRAMRQFVKYTRLDPYDPSAHRLLGDIYTHKGLLKKAEIEYNEARKLEGLL